MPKVAIILIGAPGSGKGTQSDLLKEYYKIAHVSTGNIFRENIANKTSLGLKIKAIIDDGKLVDDDLTTELLSQRLKNEDCSNGFILDGYPRTKNQAYLLNDLLKELSVDKVFAIEIVVDHDLIIKRIIGRYSCSQCGAIYNEYFTPTKVAGVCDKCGGTSFIKREDDNEATITKRLKVFDNQVEPILDYYKKEGILFSVDGTKLSKETFIDIKNTISNI